MDNSYHIALPLCASQEEVWKLMQGQVFPNSDSSIFESEELKLRISKRKYSPIVPPSDLIGLAYRVVLFLKLNGEFGKVITGGGAYTVGGALMRVIKGLSNFSDISSPLHITSLMIDKYIIKEQTKGNSTFSIYRDLFQLEQWSQYNYKLPYFLQLNHDLFNNSNRWKSLKESKIEEESNYRNGLGSSKDNYPISQLTTIVSEAIEYVENYDQECIKAIKIYKHIKSLGISDTGTMANRIAKVLSNSEELFKEPTIKLIQEHILKSKKTSWSPMEKKFRYGPLVAILDAIRKLQAACSIIILMLTAMRRSEFNTLHRYPKIEKTTHHEIDGSLQLSYMTYKTSLNKDGDLTKIPVPSLVHKAIYILSVLSELKDNRKEGYINLLDFRTNTLTGDTHNEARVGSLIYNFCNDIEIEPPTPHQFRHSMAFVVSYMNDAQGIELAMTLLGHKSIEMTKKYLGYYKNIVQNSFDIMYEENEGMKEVYKELKETLNKEALEKIIDQINQEQPMVGPIVKRISQFSGSLTKEAKIFFAKSLRLVVEKGMFAVTQFPTHFCIKDLTNPTQMACQIGLDIDDYTGAAVVPSQCEPQCSCRLYTGENIENLKEITDQMEEAYPEELRERLQQKTYFDVESFSNPFTKYINEYEQITEERSS